MGLWLVAPLALAGDAAAQLFPFTPVHLAIFPEFGQFPPRDVPVYGVAVNFFGFQDEARHHNLLLVGSGADSITPGSPWENGYCESFNGKLRDELLNGEIFYTLREAQVLIEQWRVHYNTIRPHSALGYRPPAPEIIVPGKELPMNHEAA